MIKFSGLIISLATVLQGAMLSDTCNPNTWETDGPVNAIVPAGEKVYIGGDFTHVGPYIIVGWQIRNHLTALDATTGNALAWNPNADYWVNSLAVSGSTVYAGGLFTTIGGQTRFHIAALDATTGNALAWDPYSESSVFALAVSGTTVYAGGDFDSIGGQRRNCIAALDATTGNALAWNPNAHGQVFALAVIGTTVYVGGDFDSIGGQRRHHIAALDATTGHALAWNPNANNTIRSLAVSGGMVYAGGYFDTIGGQNRNHIAALNTTSGNALIWNPNADGWVNALAVIGTTVYAAGYFTSIGGQNRSYIAALDATTGNALAWNPNAFAMNPSSNVSVHSLAVSGTAIYVGGELISMGKGAGHYYFAQFDSSYNSPVIQPVIESSGTNNIGLQIIGSRIGSGAFVKFSYALSKPDHVSLRLYTLTGRLHSVLINKHQPAGNYSLTMQRGNLAAGAYLVSFKSGDYHQEKMIFLMR